MVATKEAAFIFGGANEDGPLSDLWRFDFESRKFSRVKLTGIQLPAIEMHTSHIWKEKFLLIVGGRALPQGAKLEEIQFSDLIYKVDLDSGEVSEFAKLPSAIGSHVSAIVDEKYLVVYGGTNGFRFFDNILRYAIADSKWTLMTKQPQLLQGSPFLQDGRIACSICQVDGSYAVVFGGCSAAQDESDFMLIPFSHVGDDECFAEINEIM